MWHGTQNTSKLAAVTNKVLNKVGFGRRQLHGGTSKGSALRSLILDMRGAQSLPEKDDNNSNSDSNSDSDSDNDRDDDSNYDGDRSGSGLAKWLVGAFQRNVKRLLAASSPRWRADRAQRGWCLKRRGDGRARSCPAASQTQRAPQQCVGVRKAAADPAVAYPEVQNLSMFLGGPAGLAGCIYCTLWLARRPEWSCTYPMPTLSPHVCMNKLL
jgi:hypothetical protein